jgi:hypothetical protein
MPPKSGLAKRAVKLNRGDAVVFGKELCIKSPNSMNWPARIGHSTIRSESRGCAIFVKLGQ